MQLVKQTAKSAGIHAQKLDSMHRAKIDWKQYQQAQYKQAQHKQVHMSSTSTADQSSGKLFNMGAAIKRLGSNTIAVATAAIKQQWLQPHDTCSKFTQATHRIKQPSRTAKLR